MSSRNSQKKSYERKIFRKNFVKQKCTDFVTYASHIKILSCWMVPWSKFHNDNQKILRRRSIKFRRHGVRDFCVSPVKRSPPVQRQEWRFRRNTRCELSLRVWTDDLERFFKSTHSRYTTKLCVFYPIIFLLITAKIKFIYKALFQSTVFSSYSIRSIVRGNILSPLITPPQLFLIEERLFPLSETLLGPHFSEKRKRCVHKRGLKGRKERTLQTKII